MDEPTTEQLKQLREDILSGLVMTVTTEHYKQLQAENERLKEAFEDCMSYIDVENRTES